MTILSLKGTFTEQEPYGPYVFPATLGCVYMTDLLYSRAAFSGALSCSGKLPFRLEAI